jgi:mono/diheme cytochrome c family protein
MTRRTHWLWLHRSRAGAALIVMLALCVACGDQEFEPPDRAARVARAAAAYTPAMFDTVTWPDSAVLLTEGNTVYAEECRRCHGVLGEGNTDYARERNLNVPSLVAPGWRLAELDSLRRMIHRGHESGMPVYGDGDLSRRQIDATAAYILRTLRPDVLEQD